MNENADPPYIDTRTMPRPAVPAVLTLAPPVGPVPGVVDLLERALERARAGEIRGIAIATCSTGRTTDTAFDLGDGGVAALYLGVGYLGQRLLAEGTT